MNSLDRILENLNPPQREAVETINGPLLILAGAGSGKTRVVTRRIANLLAHGARPWEILAITFTNKAAGEMRRRVEELLVDRVADGRNVWVSTFHSFCARILRREAESLGYKRDFTIFDEEDASSALKDILKRIGLTDDKRFTPRIVRQEISSFKSQALKPDDVKEGEFHERLMARIYREYQDELLKNQALDFDDLLRMSVMLFREHPEVLQRYQDRFKYILVDEYQDTNACQYHLVKMLGQKHRNVCVTGDPDQSIYAWRGADVRNILSFERDFPEARVVKLEQNYRSTKRILQAADSVIANNRERKKKTLWTENAEGEKIILSVAMDETLEAFEVTRQIEQHVREGRRYSDMAIFYRTNAQSRAVETALIQSTIPYQLIGGTAFYERREVKDALSYLRLIVNPADDLAFRRVINVPRRALGDSAVEQIAAEATRRERSMLETLMAEDSESFINTFKPKQRQGLLEFIRLIDKLRTKPVFPVFDILQELLEISGLRKSLEEDKEIERVDNLDELLNAAAEFDKEYDPANAVLPDGPPPEPGAFDGMEEMVQRQASLAGFLENSALLAPTDNFDPNKDQVTLMTLHMAKGLEFPIVFLTGVEEGLLPLVRSMPSGLDPESIYSRENRVEDTKAVEEERRLMYVGITRAREHLYLSRAQMRRRFGRSENAIPSRFLAEIPAMLLAAVGRPPASGWASEFATTTEKTIAADDDFNAFEREVQSVFNDTPPVIRRPGIPRRQDAALKAVVDRLLDISDVQEEPRVLEIGDRVRHADFGDGTIESITGTGLSMKVKVQFRRVGPKLLKMSLAKLEKI